MKGRGSEQRPQSYKPRRGGRFLLKGILERLVGPSSGYKYTRQVTAPSWAQLYNRVRHPEAGGLLEGDGENEMIPRKGVARLYGRRETGRRMPQLQLPIFPAGVTPINPQVAVLCEADKVVYLHAHLPVFQHGREDPTSFRLFSSQMIATGTVRQAEVGRTFWAPRVTVKRYAMLYREQGAKGFFAARRRRSGSVLTPEMKGRVQALLDAWKNVPEVGRKSKLLPDTLHKATRAGHPHRWVKRTSLATAAVSSKSERTQADSEAGMGYGATRSWERVTAAMGELEAVPIQFEAAEDVAQGRGAVGTAGVAGDGAVALHAGVLHAAQGLSWDREHFLVAGADGLGAPFLP